MALVDDGLQPLVNWSTRASNSTGVGERRWQGGLEDTTAEICWLETSVDTIVNKPTSLDVKSQILEQNSRQLNMDL